VTPNTVDAHVYNITL